MKRFITVTSVSRIVRFCILVIKFCRLEVAKNFRNKFLSDSLALNLIFPIMTLTFSIITNSYTYIEGISLLALVRSHNQIVETRQPYRCRSSVSNLIAIHPAVFLCIVNYNRLFEIPRN